MSKNIVIGLDIGTSGIKYILWNGNSIIEEGRTTYSQAPSIHHEMDPGSLLSDIERLLLKITQQREAKSIKALGITTFFPSLIAIDHSGTPLTQILTWLDTRPAALVREFKKNNEADLNFRQRTGCFIHESYGLWKLYWLSQTQGNLFKHASNFMTLVEYVQLHLTGKTAVTTSVASTTGLFNIESLLWDTEILKFLGISEEKLSSCTTINHSEAMLPEIAKKLGFHQDVRVSIGTGDGLACHIGSGALDDSRMSSTIGTSSALRYTDMNSYNRPWHWRYHLNDQKFVNGIAANAGFDTIHWYFRNFLQNTSSSVFASIEGAAQRPPTNLIFLPYLSGERGPGYRQLMTASFSGMTSTDTPMDLFQALLEGVLFNLFHCYQVLTQEMPNKNWEIIASGGYTNSPSMLQLQADIFNKEIKVTDISESTAFGAALIASSAIGLQDWDKIDVSFKKNIQPDLRRHSILSHKFKQYQKLWALYSANISH